MFGKEKKAEDKKKETALKREENRKKSGVKQSKNRQATEIFRVCSD